ncbi:MAG: LptF/LptG family permease [Fibromonadaceae bacterium]|jgi:lipopolysaccharide export system permease protein|nr:LptF/LptG family permease [Fibromonadaceae bacterium]
MKFSLYMLGNFLKSFTLILVGSVLVFIVIDFVGNIKMWLLRGMEQTGEYYLNYLPYIVYLVSPVAIMLTAIASVGAMARHLEISAMQGAGRGPFRILLPTLMAGIVITALLFVIGEMILPDANYRRLEIAETRMEQRKNPRIKEKHQFIFIGSDHSDWYFKRYSGVTKKGEQISIVLQDNSKPIARYDARNMEWGDSSWVLFNGWARYFAHDGNLTAYKFKKLDIGKQTSVLPEDIINERQSHEEMSARQISRRIEILRRSGEDTKKMETQRHFKYSGPVTALVTLIIALSLSHKYSRSGALSQQFGIGIILTFSYYIVVRVGLQMGENGILDPWLGAWAGHIIYGTVAIAMLLRSFRL